MRVELIDNKGREIKVSRRDARLLIAIGKATLKPPAVKVPPVAAILRAEPVPTPQPVEPVPTQPVEAEAVPVVAPDVPIDSPRETLLPMAANADETKVVPPETVPTEPALSSTEVDEKVPPDGETEVERTKRKYKKRDLTAGSGGGYKTRHMVAGK